MYNLYDLGQRVLKSRGLWFLVVGGCILMAQLFALRYVVETFDMEKRVASPVIDIIAIQISFLVNRFVNWRDRTGSLFSQWKKFHHIRGATYLANQVLFFVLVPWGVPYLELKMALAVAEVGVHFYFNDTYAFKGV